MAIFLHFLIFLCFHVDCSKDIESEGHDGDLSSGSSTPENFEASLPSGTRHIEGSGKLYSFNPSNESLPTQKVSNVNDGDSKHLITGKHLGSSDDNGFRESCIDSKDFGALPEKKTVVNIHKDHGEFHSESEAHLYNSGSLEAEKTKPSIVNEKEVADKTLMRHGSSENEANSVLNSEEKCKPMDMESRVESREDVKPRPSSLSTPKLMSRTSSPVSELDRSKRPAILCEFFARGWCIKGSSCRFLHQEDGVDNSGQCAKGDVSVASWRGDVQVDAGLKQDIETSRLSGFPEPLASTVENNPSLKSIFPSERAPIWEHGESQSFHEEHKLSSLQREDLSLGVERTESGPTSIVPHDFQRLPLTRDNHGLIFSFKDVGRENLKQSLCQDDYSRHALPVTKGDFPKFDTHARDWVANPNEFQKISSIGEEFNRPFGISSLYENRNPLSDVTGNKPSVNDEFMRGYPLARSSLFPEYRISSSGSVISSSIFGSHRNPSAYVTNVEEPVSLKHQSQFMLNDHASPVLRHNPNIKSNTSLPSAGISPSRHTFAWPGSSSSHSSSSLSTMPLGVQKLLESERGYHASRSSSLPRSSSSPFSSSEPENLLLHSVHGDPRFSVGHKTPNTWEPSVPFRPSFYFAPPSISFPGSQYDPLLDSIELPSGDKTLWASSSSRGATIQNISQQQANGDPALNGPRTAEYNAGELSISFHEQSHGSVLDKKSYTHGTVLHTNEAGTAGTSVVDWQNRNSMPKEEKPLGPTHVVDVTKINEMVLDSNPRHQTEGGRHKKKLKADSRHNNEMDLDYNPIHQTDGVIYNKESKSLKLFHAALVDFVKELVKPSWREGHLSKDAHKTIVKKAVDKVLSTLQPFQIPSTMESIKQYLSSSQPKISKLVEGYVDKYAKS
ncbi:hypothetical protein HHK36_023622 [Tetracentron sinense]|uniref:C3H1-type domain-containing protein n=1 Tax=Tetracentron sinense TaxID=13715 RepID=A0A835D5J8_TETSI|nr:hypothetical protein HHK36_023622 [Tetracentron sinense]